MLTSCECFQVNVKAPVQDMVTWVTTLQATELCRGCSFLWFATLLFEKVLETLKEGKSKAVYFGNVKGGALPSATVNSNAHCKDQCKHHQSSNDDQPVCRDRWGRGREHVNVANESLPFHRSAETTSLLLPFRCHTLLLAPVNVCLVYKVFPCKSKTFSSLRYTQASSD